MSCTDDVTKPGPEDISHMAQGHKANLSNPNTSEKSKDHSRQVLKDMGGESAFYSKAYEIPVVTDQHSLAGHRAAVNNPNVSQEAKEHSQRIVDKST